VLLGEKIPFERGHQRGVAPKNRYLPLSARLARERLQIDTDLLLIITRTADKHFGGTNIDDLNDLNPKNMGF